MRNGGPVTTHRRAGVFRVGGDQWRKRNPYGTLDRMTFRLALLAFLTLVALAPSSAAATLTREQVINRGDSICYDVDTAVNAARREHRPYDPFSRYHDNLAALMRQGLRISKRGTRRFARLIERAPADGDKWRLTAWLNGVRGQHPRIRRLARAADAGNLNKVNATIYTIERYTRKYRKHARAYGFSDCGYS